MMLTLQNMIDNDRKLATSLPQLSAIPGGPKPAKGFLEQKRDEEKTRLEAEIEVEERKRYLDQLREGATGAPSGVRGKTYVVTPGATTDEEKVQEVSGAPIVITSARGEGGGSNGDILSLLVQDLIARANAKSGEAPETEAYVINPEADNEADRVRPVGKQPTVIMIGKKEGDVSKPSTLADEIRGFFKGLSDASDLRSIVREFIGIPPPGTGTPPTSPTVIQAKDTNGNPLTLDIGSAIQWQTFVGEQRRKDETHEEVKSALRTAREQFPKIVNAIDRVTKKGTSELIEVPCETCGAKTKVPRGTQQFQCGGCQTINGVEW